MNHNDSNVNLTAQDCQNMDELTHANPSPHLDVVVGKYRFREFANGDRQIEFTSSDGECVTPRHLSPHHISCAAAMAREVDRLRTKARSDAADHLATDGQATELAIQVTDLQKKITALSGALGGCVADNAWYKGEVTHLKKGTEALSEALSEALDQAESKYGELQVQANAYKENWQHWHDQWVEAKNMYNVLQASFAGAVRDHSAAKIAELEESIAGQHRELCNWRSGQAQVHIDNLVGDKAVLKRQLAEADRVNVEVIKERDAAQDGLAAISKEKTRLVGEWDAKAARYREKWAERDKEHMQLRTRCTDALNSRDILLKGLSKMTAEVKRLNDLNSESSRTKESDHG